MGNALKFSEIMAASMSICLCAYLSIFFVFCFVYFLKAVCMKSLEFRRLKLIAMLWFWSFKIHFKDAVTNKEKYLITSNVSKGKPTLRIEQQSLLRSSLKILTESARIFKDKGLLTSRRLVQSARFYEEWSYMWLGQNVMFVLFQL